MSAALYRIGRLAARRPWMVVALWVMLAAAVLIGSSSLGRDLEDSFEVPGVDSERATQLLTSAGAAEAGLTAQVVATPLDRNATFTSSAEGRSGLADLAGALGSASSVLAVTDPAGSIGSDPQGAIDAGELSADGRVALLRVQYPVLEELDAEDLESLQTAIDDVQESSGLRIEAGGDLFFAFEEPQGGFGEALGVLAAAVVLLVVFGSFIAAGLPIGTALFGLLFGVSSMSLVAHIVGIPSWAPALAAMVGLGVGIDYALLLVTRQRENLRQGMDADHALGSTVATAGQAAVFAGGTVVVAILGLAVTGIPFITSAGIAISLVVLVMVAASITLLPALLALVGTRILRTPLRRRSRRVPGPEVSERWQRWGAHVGRHAWGYTIGVTAVLLALAAPVLALRLGFPDEGTLPDSRTERRAYDLVAEGFGPGSNGPLVVAVDTSGDATVVDPLAEAIGADPGIEKVSASPADPATGVATLIAQPTTAPQDADTRETVERLRSEVIPVVLGDGPAVAHVGGQTANVADVAERVQQRLPWFIAAVILLSFLLLTVVFRSLLVPLKAALLNLLGIGAAYGVIVMVFQWGWGASLIGVEGPVPIVSFIPMFMFAVLFGLSMDYEVFLLSRVREEYRRTGDNDAAVIRGLASTARVITSAALIMIFVFAGFVLGDDPTTKMWGLGLATAILVDVSIVRMVLVPATMRLMGDANWWLPGWLDRVLPKIDVDGPAAPPTPPTPPQPPSPVSEEPVPV